MPPPVPEQLSRTIEALYRSESGRVLATLVRLLGDLDLAEESMHEAFAFNGTIQGHRRYAPAGALQWCTERSRCPYEIARQQRSQRE
jgi:predicted RNA polymerase sigma factor